MTAVGQTETTGSYLAVEVISDVMCPWCYVGKRRLARARDLAPEIAADVTWRPFRLDPTLPPEGISRDDYLTRKFGPDRASDMYDRLVQVGEEEGIAFNFDRIERAPNTVDAHRLILWAAAQGLQDEVVERLFVAYFSEGRDIGDVAVLARIAEEAGLGGDIPGRLAGDEDRERTVAEIENAYRIGVTGVPAFIFGQRIAVLGAHPPETLMQAMEQALSETASGDTA